MPVLRTSPRAVSVCLKGIPLVNNNLLWSHLVHPMSSGFEFRFPVLLPWCIKLGF